METQNNREMSKPNLMAVRSNCTFELHYQEGTLSPKAEVIIITAGPKYVRKEDEIFRDVEVSEYRFESDLDGINKLIGELQLVVNNMNKFEQLSCSLNAIIKSNQTNK